MRRARHHGSRCTEAPSGPPAGGGPRVAGLDAPFHLPAGARGPGERRKTNTRGPDVGAAGVSTSWNVRRLRSHPRDARRARVLGALLRCAAHARERRAEQGEHGADPHQVHQRLGAELHHRQLRVRSGARQHHRDAAIVGVETGDVHLAEAGRRRAHRLGALSAGTQVGRDVEHLAVLAHRDVGVGAHLGAVLHAEALEHVADAADLDELVFGSQVMPSSGAVSVRFTSSGER